jgi:acyl-CoA synthetase (AMP-forming)/AMP-acid ligase II
VRQLAIVEALIGLLAPRGGSARLAEAYLRQGDVCTLLRRYDAADRALGTSLRLSRELGDRAAERNALRSLGLLRSHEGRQAEAAARIEEALALDEALGEAVKARLGCGMIQGYGMTELSPVSHIIPLDRDDISPGTVGLLLPNMQARIVDPATGADLGPGEPGELWLRGPNVMVGYLNNPTATAATIDPDGWLRTGDVATVDEHGVYAIIDRVKELIKYKAYQVPPAELEALLLTHPSIADAAVIGIRDDDGEEVPKAFVVRQPAAPELSADDVMSFVAARVAPHKKGRAVEFIDAIPKSASGKILRKDLRTR